MFQRLKPFTLLLVGVLLLGGVLSVAASFGPAPAQQNDTAVIAGVDETLPGLLPPQAPPAEGDAEPGAYIFALAGGCGCHNGQAGLLAGGAPFEGPFGKVYAPNVTPDSGTGIGEWSDAEIIDAIRLGKTPDGNQLFPIMPYPTFSNMSDEDVQDLVAFMRTVPAVDNEIPERELNFPVEAYTPRAAAPATAPTAGVERGSYIANAIAHCGDCHTPRTATGAPDMSKMLAGAIIEGAVAPNLTPDEATGIGSWSEEEIATLLQTGVEPSGKKVEGLMALLIEGGYKDMTDDDALAVAAYLKSVPAVENEVELPAAEVAEEAAPAEESAPAATPPTTLPVSGDENVTLPFALLLSVLGGASLLAGFILYRRQHQA